MKKIPAFIILVLSFVSSSCQKYYSCECTTTVQYPNKDPYKSTSIEKISQKTTKKQAEAICRASEAQLNEQFKQQLINSSPPVPSSSACTLK